MQKSCGKKQPNHKNKSLHEDKQPETLKYLDDYLKESRSKLDGSERLSDGTSLSKVRPVVENFLKELVENNDFCLNRSDNESVLSNIMAEHFKNQFETGTSGGELCYGFRKLKATQIFGVPENIVNNMLGEKKINNNNNTNTGPLSNWNDDYKYIYSGGKNFEKYGYLDKKENLNSIAFKHGPIKFILRKNSLRGRTTMTFDNSLVYSEILTASRVTDPKIESIPGVKSKSYSMMLEPLYQLITHNEIHSTDNIDDILCKLSPLCYTYTMDQKIQYIELQFHGNLTKDDVAECFIPSSESKNVESIFKDNNIPVRRY